MAVDRFVQNFKFAVETLLNSSYSIDCSQPLYFSMHAKEKPVRHTGGGGVTAGWRAKRAKRRVFLGPQPLPYLVSSFALESISLS